MQFPSVLVGHHLFQSFSAFEQSPPLCDFVGGISAASVPSNWTIDVVLPTKNFVPDAYISGNWVAGLVDIPDFYDKNSSFSFNVYNIPL